MVTLPADLAMNCSDPRRPDLLPEHSAPQHERAPRPLPLFLELIRNVSERDPALARDALAGLRAYGIAERRPQLEPAPEISRVQGSCLRDHGGNGPVAILIPSLINPPRILHLDEQVSLAGAIARMGRRALLLDWGAAGDRQELSIAGHVEELLLPLLHSIGEPCALVGYCLGGTMAIAAANLHRCERVATLAAPWHFALYPPSSRAAMHDMWCHSEPASRKLGALPMEVLQASFWSLDPERTVLKFAQFAKLDQRSLEAQRFVELEDWANEGEPLPYRAAKELVEDLFERDSSGNGKWRVGGRAVDEHLEAPILNVTAERDRIAPASTAPAGARLRIDAGHVGMIVGSARSILHEALRDFLGSD